jgi:hypothetical protein
MSKQRAGLLLALCLLALTAVPAMASTDIKYVLQCGNAKSVPPDDDEHTYWLLAWRDCGF